MDNLYTASIHTLLPLTLHETYEAIVNEAMNLVGAKYGSIFFPQEGEMRRVYASSSLLQMIKPRKRGRTYRVFHTNTPYLHHQIRNRQVHPEVERLHVGSDISVPLSFGEDRLGVLSVLSDENVRFEADDLIALQQFAAHASLVIKKVRTAETLQSSLERRDVFLSIVAHELKNPLTALSTYSQLIQVDQTNSMDKVVNLGRKMEGETKRLIQLVDELLGLGKLNLNDLPITLKKCDMREMMNVVLADCALMYPNHRLSYKKDLPRNQVFILGDRNKLLQVVINLVSNAAKYSPTGTTITLTLKHTGHQVTLSVSDKGKGIPESELKNIFRRFYRASESDNTSMGLGLYLVKHIIDKHHGTISINSKVGKGTTVTVTLPEYGKS